MSLCEVLNVWSVLPRARGIGDHKTYYCRNFFLYAFCLTSRSSQKTAVVTRCDWQQYRSSRPTAMRFTQMNHASCSTSSKQHVRYSFCQLVTHNNNRSLASSFATWLVTIINFLNSKWPCFYSRADARYWKQPRQRRMVLRWRRPVSRASVTSGNARQPAGRDNIAPGLDDCWCWS